MNKKNNKMLPEAQFLINHVGEFIDYWGFKSIEGKMWCLTFISNKPLGPADYIEAFGISKGLVSQCVKRLVEYDVFIEVAEPGRKKQFYTANQDLAAVIKGVLRQRERKILRDVESSAKDLTTVDSLQLDEACISKKKVEELTKLTQSAKSLLEMLLFDGKKLFP